MADGSEPKRVLGVLAGSDMLPTQLAAWVASADVVFAADGGADRLLAIGVIPSATVGDLDSITPGASQAQTRLLKDDDQNTTDCDKLLAFSAAGGHQAITLIGAEGDLLDHVIGTVQSAARSPLAVRLALRRGIGLFATGPCELSIGILTGARLSVIPLDRCEGVTLSGARWPLEDALLEPFGLTSLSNIAESERIELKLRSGRAFVFAETDGAPRWGEL